MKMTNIETQKITTKIKDVETRKFIAKAGQVTNIVLVKTDDGIFTNYLNVWEKQHIDLDKIKEGDIISIVYTTFYDKKKDHTYKNFLSIDII